jgi:hypothetical protein
LLIGFNKNNIDLLVFDTAECSTGEQLLFVFVRDWVENCTLLVGDFYLVFLERGLGGVRGGVG